MNLMAVSSDLIMLFLAIETASIPLYVLCATEMRRATSLESGLKYLIIGSVGSATLVYGLALKAWPVVAANTVTLVLALAILGMKLHYGRRSNSAG